MSEFCLECWNKINDTSIRKKDVILSSELDLCEGCGQWKPVIVRFTKWYCLKERLQRKRGRTLGRTLIRKY